MACAGRRGVLSLYTRCGGHFGRGSAQQAVDLAAIEAVLLAAELAADPGLAIAGVHRGMGLVRAQLHQHGLHSLPRTGAAETERECVKHLRCLLVEQPMDDIGRRQGQELG